jgi:hypothetical protein
VQLRLLGDFLFLLVVAIALVMAFKSLTAKRCLPFHEKAAGAGWETLDPKLQALIISLMRINGFAFLAVSLQFLQGW